MSSHSIIAWNLARSSPVPDHHNLPPVAYTRGQQPAHDTHQYGPKDSRPKTVDLEPFHEP